MTLETNIAIREEAEAAFVLVKETADALPEDHRQRFWEVVNFHVASAAGIVPGEDPADSGRMNDTQARLFSETEMPFGKYTGTPVGEVVLDYLFWLVEQPDDFKDNLRRYLRSDRMQREQGDE